jgi:hypothetical protein
MRVLLHTIPASGGSRDLFETFEQIPRVGEYVCLPSESGEDWYRVALVVWEPERATKRSGTHQVEIYAVEVDLRAVLRTIRGTEPVVKGLLD